MSKIKFEESVENWIKNLINNMNEFKLLKIFKKQNISKINNPLLINIDDIFLYDFICDYSILIEKNNGIKGLILVNSFFKSIGLTEIGEMNVYCKIARPVFAFMISSKGHSSEINKVLINDSIAKKLFNYSDNQSICLFKLNKNQIDQNTILPIYLRNEIYEQINFKN